MIKAVIFDYDGVIVDSFLHVYEVYKVICAALSVEIPDTLEEFRKVYGYNSKECYRNLGIAKEDYIKASEIFKREILKRDIGMFDGIKEVLLELSKKYKLILISSAYTEEIVQKLEKFGIRDLFMDIIGKTEPGAHRNKEHDFIETVEQLGLDADEIILVGDRAVDYDEGTRAGLKNIILVDYGWGYDKKRFKQEVVVEKPADMLEAVERIDGRTG
jgi:HAD superfamily hydrolase (TIGR01549 family)